MKDSEISPLEGDYIETMEGLLFAVKGIHHPPGYTIAYLRYIPDPQGRREKGGRRYRRLYDIGETDDILRRKYPQYLNKIERKSITLQSVPDDFVRRRYNPREMLDEILEAPEGALEETILKLVRSLEEQGASPKVMGISGSVLVGLAGQGSDIDLISYGKEEGRRFYEILKELREEGDLIRPYNAKSVRGVVVARWGDTGLDLDLLTLIEQRKVLHGLVDGRDYFVRLVKLPQEFEEEYSQPVGVVSLKGVVGNISDSIYTPCIYRIKGIHFLGGFRGPEPSELLSYRGKFTEQAEEGDIVELRGTLEKAIREGQTVHRIVLGAKGDYLVPVDSFEG
ncbi:MAG: hypothetical protein PVJ38_05490 [Candidatus Bathyarchaeota archaeon]|jgi:predicted nucleotidyltransferase